MDTATYNVDVRPHAEGIPGRETLNEVMAGSVEDNAKPIRITPLAYGYIIKVGCQSFAIEGKKKLIKLLGDYLENPLEVEKAWLEKDVGSMFYPAL